MNEQRFVLHIGDISYADNFKDRNETYEGSWTRWQELVEPITKQIPYMTLPGNHDIACDEDNINNCPVGQQNMTAYKHRFRMPGPESGGTGNLWYSFDYGVGHFIQLNFETDFPNAPSGINSSLHGGGEVGQLEWLEQDLIDANQNREVVPWVIVSAHRPFYTSDGVCDACVAAFEGLFNKYGVDVYFAGHVHWYERLYAVSPGGIVENTNYIDPKAPVYIVNGAAGNVEGHSDSQTPKNYTAVIDNSDYGYGVLSFENRTSLSWAFYRATDQSLVDQIQIVKHR